MTPNIIPGQIVYARGDGSKHEARDPLLVTGVDGKKIQVQKIIHSHPTSEKVPKITSQKITADEKFLYVPPHRRLNITASRGSSEDAWWRGPRTSTCTAPSRWTSTALGTAPTRWTSSATSAPVTKWTPTHRYNYDDDDGDDEMMTPVAAPIPQQVGEFVDAEEDLVVPPLFDDLGDEHEENDDGNNDVNAADQDDCEEEDVDLDEEDSARSNEDQPDNMMIRAVEDVNTPNDSDENSEPNLPLTPIPRLFENHEDQPPVRRDEVNEIPPPYIPPVTGDPIQIFDPTTDSWKSLVITHTSASCLRTDPDYYNYRVDDGSKGSAHLTKDSVWRHAHHDRRNYYWWRWRHLYEDVV